MKQKSVWILVLLALGGAAALAWRSQDRRRETARPKYSEVAAERGDIASTVLATGTVQPENRLEIKPPIAGRIEEILVREGQKVAKGRILAWMSSTERAALLDAARAQGDAEVKKWEDLYRPTPILAPIAGTVILRQVETGQTFTSADPVFVMSDRLTVKAQVDETDIAAIAVGQEAAITLDAYAALTIPARVDQVAFDAATVNNVTTYEVTVLPAQVPAQMKSGMTASVSFVAQRREGVVLLPARAVAREGKESAVLVRDPAAKDPVRRPVETGLSDGKRVEIVSGVAAGESVLVLDTEALQRKEGGTNPFAPNMPRRR